MKQIRSIRFSKADLEKAEEQGIDINEICRSAVADSLAEPRIGKIALSENTEIVWAKTESGLYWGCLYIDGESIPHTAGKWRVKNLYELKEIMKNCYAKDLKRKKNELV